MKITILHTELGGTGGALNCILIANKFVCEGHDVKIFVASMSPESIRELILASLSPLQDFNPQLDADATIAFNMTSLLQPLFLQAKGRKFFRFGLMHPEYQVVMDDKNVTKIATTSYGKTYVEKVPTTKNVVAIPGPTNPTDFFPEEMQRSNIVLTYLKKSGWVAVDAINRVQDALPSIVFASMTDDGLSSLPIKSRYPIAILGAPAHLKSHVRYCYGRAGVFVDTHSNGPWGWNCCVGEAMLTGCPVVCTDSAEFSDLIIPNETALAVKCDDAPEYPNDNWMTRPDPQAVADGIITLLQDRELCARLTTNALEQARTFDVNNWYTEFMKLW